MLIDNFKEQAAKREENRKQRIAALDDGSVRGLILTSDDSKHLGTWTELNVDKEIAELLGKCVLSEDNAFTVATTICRKKIKKEDIILCNFTADNECGVAITENEIYSFWDGELEYVVPYSEIKSVDFEKDTVTVVLADGEEADLYCDCEEYTEHLYSLIMDIKNRLDESKTENC